MRGRRNVCDELNVEFYRHVVRQGVTKVLDSKVRAIKEWPQPRNVQEVRQFYGLVNYYCRFIRHFSIIAAPLSDLFKLKITINENGAQLSGPRYIRLHLNVLKMRSLVH